jgi:hypothetical protein
VDSVDYQRILQVFRTDSPARDGALPEGDKWITTDLERVFAGKEATKSVLGIDIYRYSSYAPEQQRVIPALFRYLYEAASDFCVKQESFLFQAQALREQFIPTGDGGFQIVDTPLHALVLAIYLQSNIEAFNGYLVFSRLRRILGPLRLRYAVTLDSVFRLDSNYFGSAIINNARILARDTLNRFLVDAATVEWFQSLIGSIESLQLLTREELFRLAPFRDYREADAQCSLFPEAASGQQTALRTIHLQHIGHVGAKRSVLEVFNLHVQVIVRRAAEDGSSTPRLMISLGNLNVGGISD